MMFPTGYVSRPASIQLPQQLPLSRLELLYPLGVDGDTYPPHFWMHAEGCFEKMVPAFGGFGIEVRVVVLKDDAIRR
jgi:hypothetical protein